MNQEQRAAVLEEVYKRGYRYEGENRGCAQAFMKAVYDVFGFDDGYKHVFKSASTFAAGGSGGGTGFCGCLSGSMMTLAYLFGRDMDHFDQKPKVFEDKKMVNAFRVKFEETYGGETCYDIQDSILGRHYDFHNPEEVKLFDAAGGHTDKCTDVVGKAAVWFTEYLLDLGVEPKGEVVKALNI